MDRNHKFFAIVSTVFLVFLVTVLAGYDDPSGTDLDDYVGEVPDLDGYDYDSRDFCDVDSIEIAVRNPDGGIHDWMHLDRDEDYDEDDCVEFYDEHSYESPIYQDPDYDSVDGEDMAYESSWTGVEYEHCDMEGYHDARIRADLEMDDGDYMLVESDWYDNVYYVDFHTSNWCTECRGEEWIGYYNPDEVPEFLEDEGDLGCCMTEHPEYAREFTWGSSGNLETVDGETDPGSAKEACVRGEPVEEGPAPENPEFLVSDGRINYCRIPGEDVRHDYESHVVDDRYECGYEATDTGIYYCGAGVEEHEGEWNLLEDSGCDQIVKRMRGGRIEVK